MTFKDWKEVIDILGGVTVIVAALAWLLREVYKNFNSRRASNYEAILEQNAAMLKSRGESYGDIWNLTGRLNLFGPTKTLEKATLLEFSDKLKDWYFTHGLVLTKDSKERYFLVHEILHFAMLHSLSFTRPKDELLYGGTEPTLKKLRSQRQEIHNIKEIGDEKMYQPEDLRGYVTRWKETILQQDAAKARAESHWILLQLCLSAFRSGLLADLSSRKVLTAA